MGIMFPWVSGTTRAPLRPNGTTRGVSLDTALVVPLECFAGGGPDSTPSRLPHCYRLRLRDVILTGVLDQRDIVRHGRTRRGRCRAQIDQGHGNHASR